MKAIRIVVLILTLTFTVLSGQAWASVYDDVQESLICPACLDDRMTVASCNDSAAEQARQDIQQRLASGQSKEQIIDDYVAKYGETILAVPRKSGFNIVAWVVPPIAVIGGIAIVYLAISRWVRNHGGVKPNRETGQRVIDSVDEDRLNEEMIKYL